MPREELDIMPGLQSSWAVSFSVLYLIVMVLSVLLYLATVRALARHGRWHSVTHYLVLLLFFAALVEFALLLEEFMNRFGLFLFTTANCQLFQYTINGNRILQVSVVLTLLYYNWLAVHLKTTRCEAAGRRWFPALVAALLLLELAAALPSALRHSAGPGLRSCVRAPGHRAEAWLEDLLLPYCLPLLLALPPAVVLGLALRRRALVEPRQSQVRIGLAVSGSYFLFHLLYFLLAAAKLAEGTERGGAERWHILLGLSVWHVTRPMFALLGLGWHLMTPLACLLLDRELRQEWPGRLLVRAEEEGEEAPIPLSPRGGQGPCQGGEGGQQGAGGLEGGLEGGLQAAAASIKSGTELSSNFSALMLEHREFHNPSFPVH